MADSEPAVAHPADQRVTGEEDLDRLPLVHAEFAESLRVSVLAVQHADAEILAGWGTRQSQMRIA
jgi:hypothetical protein